MIRSLVRQGERHAVDVVKRCARQLTSPWGRMIDALIVPRSYQETLEGEFGSVQNALDQIDSIWRERDLIVFPSHLNLSDCEESIKLAHGSGFDVVAIPVLLQTHELPAYQDCLLLPWNERWTVFNEQSDNAIAMAEALGHDLWVWISSTLEHR